MKLQLSIREDSKNYTCQVVEISNIRNHSNADRLNCTTIQGNNVICGKEVQIGDKCLYFPLESQISKEFCVLNDLIRRKDEYAKVAGGMFDDKRRVKAISLRGEKSEGFICPLNSLNVLGIDSNFLGVGDEFTDIDGVNICQKYIIKIPIIRGEKENNAKQTNRILDNQVRLHVDTEQLKKNIDKLDKGDFISIHYKKHGTSWWAGNLLVKRKLSWLEKLAYKFGVKIKDTEFDIVYGSRRTIKNKFENPKINHYYSYDLWADIKDQVKDLIPKGYTLYGEAIGYTKDGAYIQKDYDYGCEHSTMKVYIYRITITNEDGKVIDLDCRQIKEFCDKFGLNYSDTFKFYGTVESLYNSLLKKYDTTEDRHWHDQLLDLLIKEYNDKDCYMCKNSLPEEGIVLRRQRLFEYEAYKLKSFKFLEKESKQLDNNEVNIEDNA